MAECEHLQIETTADPNTTEGCEECLEQGDTDWVDLRVCAQCGHVGCCGSSPDKHAQQHFEETGHPVIEPLEDDWLWCYEHETYD